MATMDARYLWGRKSDLGFAKSEGSLARRHHIRLWQAQELIDGAMVWIGSVHYDRKVGLRLVTGQLTHRIGADLDAERDLLIRHLTELELSKKIHTVAIPHAQLKGKNSTGSRYFTDGKLKVAIL